MLTKVLLILTILATTQGGLFDDGPLPIRQQFYPPAPPFFRQSRPPNSYPPPQPPPPPPLDVRRILSQVPIISNLFGGANQADATPQNVNNVPRFDTQPPKELTSERDSIPAAKHVEYDNEINRNEWPDKDILSAVKETYDGVLDEVMTSTTEDYETTTDDDLLSRMGPPPAVVASLLG